MATSRLSARPLVLRRCAEPARDYRLFLVHAYDFLLRPQTASPPTGHAASAPAPAPTAWSTAASEAPLPLPFAAATSVASN